MMGLVAPLLFPVLLAAEPDVKELLDKEKKEVGIQYEVNTNIADAELKGGKAPGNQIWRTTVILKETKGVARRLIVCLHGASVVLTGRTKKESLRAIALKRNGNNLECEIVDKAEDKDRFFGNLGCQNVALAANATLKVNFVTAARPPADKPEEAPVQDGNYREANGPGGPFGAGHRQFGARDRFGKLIALRQALDDLFLNVAILDNAAVKMGCVKKDDAKNTKADNDARRPPYTPADCAEIAKDKTCNRCFGMNTHMVLDKLGANVTLLPTVTVKYNTIKTVALGNIPLNGERVVVTNARASVEFQPNPGSPNPFSPCDPGSPACFAMEPPIGTTFPLLEGANQYGLLKVNFPSFLSDSFGGTFVVTLTAESGELLLRNRIPVKKDLTCDVTGDGQVNVQDINEIMSVIGATADPGSPYDPDNSGTITVGDARACVLKCSKSNCVE